MPNALNIVKVERNLLITKKKNNCCIIRAMSVSKVHAFENVKYLKSWLRLINYNTVDKS